jgi:hypothetical protein
MGITYTSVSNLAYANQTGTAIQMTVQFGHLLQPALFVAMGSDPEQHGRQLYADAIAGKYGPIAPYVAPPVKSKS